jgi:hypothetical protein
MVKRTFKLTIGLAVMALMVLPAAVLTQGVVGRVLNRRTRAVFPTLTAALAAALPGDTLLLAGNIVEPGPVSLAGFSGIIIGETRIGFQPTVTQTATGVCAFAFDCLIDASGRVGPVQIIGVNFRLDDEVAGISSIDTGFPLTIRNNRFIGTAAANDIIGIAIGDNGGPYRIENNTVTCGSDFCIGIGVVGLTFPGPVAAPITSLSIIGNRINDLIAGGFTLGIGLADVAGGPITIERNTIDGTGADAGSPGMLLGTFLLGVGVERAIVQKNTIRNFSSMGSAGLVLSDADGTQVRLNRFQNIFSGIVVDIDLVGTPDSYDEGITPPLAIRNNNFFGTPAAQSAVVFCDGDCAGAAPNGNTLDASSNFWGAASGPGSFIGVANTCPEATGGSCLTPQPGATDGTGLRIALNDLVTPECGNVPRRVVTCPHRTIAVIGAGSGG